MSRGVLFRIREYPKGGLWIFPLTGAVLGQLAANPRSHPPPLAQRAAAAPSVKTTSEKRNPS
jgi:hypothetical protein